MDTEAEQADRQITCSLCGFSFPLSEARATVCQKCPLRGGCGMLIKCPNCGYEMPLMKMPAWIGNLLSKLGNWVSGKK